MPNRCRNLPNRQNVLRDEFAFATIMKIKCE